MFKHHLKNALSKIEKETKKGESNISKDEDETVCRQSLNEEYQVEKIFDT